MSEILTPERAAAILEANSALRLNLGLNEVSDLDRLFTDNDLLASVSRGINFSLAINAKKITNSVDPEDITV